MGLETVELVMAVEEEFRIAIPDEAAPGLAVVGEMHDYILRALQQRGETPDDEVIWQRLRTLIVEQIGVKPAEVTRDAHFVHDLNLD